MTAAFGSTTTVARTLKVVLDEANPNDLADGLRSLKLGTGDVLIKRTFTGLTGAATYDLTALDGTGETVGTSNVNRIAAKSVRTLRVTAATTANSVGSYAITDASGTVLSPTASSVVGLAKLSDDGKTLTFATADVTAFIIGYFPLVLSSTQMAANFPT